MCGLWVCKWVKYFSTGFVIESVVNERVWVLGRIEDDRIRLINGIDIKLKMGF